MATPSEKLAPSREILGKLQTSNGTAAIRARNLSRTHRERLLSNGFLQEVIKGRLIPSRPDEVKGGSMAWYASFWRSDCTQACRPVSMTHSELRKARSCSFLGNSVFRVVPELSGPLRTASR